MPEERQYTLERALITGQLRTRTPLFIGGGLLVESPEGQETGSIATVVSDGGGNPVIPASTLRGFLRRCCGGKAADEFLFGSARRAVDASAPKHTQDPGRAGALRVYDARWAPYQVYEPHRQERVAIDPVLGTAREGALFATETVNPGGVFDCRFELDRVTESELERFLDALRAWDGGPQSRIGAGKSRMQGQMEWVASSESVRVLRRPSFRDWLRGTDPLDSYWELHYPAEATGQKKPDTSENSAVTSDAQLRLSIKPESPMLVNGRIRAGEDGHQVRSFPRDGDETWLTASSLRGVLRGRIRRVLLSKIAAVSEELEEHRRRPIADAMVSEIMGGASESSTLQFGEATARYTEDEHVHRQTFVAIDRFSGGAADQHLYKVEAVKPDAYGVDVYIVSNRPLDPWKRGLIIYLLRDAMEADLQIGWGRARGFGAFRVEVHHGSKHYAHWGELLGALDAGAFPFDRDQVRTWLDAVDSEVSGRISPVQEDEEAAT